MRNLIIIISVLFVTIIAVSYFYFSNLGEKERAQAYESESDEIEAEQAEPITNGGMLWTFDLNGGATTVPSVQLYDDSSRVILVQDAYHILHAISPDGQKLWNAQLPGPIVDSISQLPDRSLVFTTADRLYRIDTEGDPLPGFSLTLPQQATHGAVVIPSEADDGTVRIEVASNRQVMWYDGRGNLVRRQAQSQRSGTDNTTPGADSPILTDVSPDCGPLVYVGPLHSDGQRYVLCGKSDDKLYCMRY